MGLVAGDIFLLMQLIVVAMCNKEEGVGTVASIGPPRSHPHTIIPSSEHTNPLSPPFRPPFVVYCVCRSMVDGSSQAAPSQTGTIHAAPRRTVARSPCGIGRCYGTDAEPYCGTGRHTLRPSGGLCH